MRLAEAYSVAEGVGTDRWQYAVPVEILRQHDELATAELQWLVSEGLAEARSETAPRNSRSRSFRRAGAIGARNSLALAITRAGLRRAQRLLKANHVLDGAATLPQWDSASGELTYRGLVVKHLADRASAQRSVLEAGEARRWANPIDSPFANLPVTERAHYLGQVLSHLNSGQKDARLRFSACDKGLRFRWTATGTA
jgi:hypothetical protein